MNNNDAHPIMILAEGDGWLVANKPAGIETVAEGDALSLTHALRCQCQHNALMPIHRIDRDTSGCVLFATSETSREMLVDTFNRADVFKCYLALCLGVPHEPEGRIELPLSRWSAGHRPVQVQPRGGLSASTSYRVLLTSEPLRRGHHPTLTVSLMAFRIYTGRTHQIRVHAEACGFPVLGDDQYGARPANKALRELTGLNRQALHAFRLIVPTGAGVDNRQSIEAEALLPEDMVAVCDFFFDNWKKRLNRALKKLLPQSGF